MPSSGDNKALCTECAEENKWVLPFTACLKRLWMWLQALEFFAYFHTYTATHTLSHTHTSTSMSTKRSAGILISFSPLPQHNNFGLSSASLAEGEELVDDASRFAQELLGAELQLFVALVDGRLHFPEVLDGGRVQGVECGKPSNKVLKLIWKTGRCTMRVENSFLCTYTGQTNSLTSI